MRPLLTPYLIQAIYKCIVCPLNCPLAHCSLSFIHLKHKYFCLKHFRQDYFSWGVLNRDHYTILRLSFSIC